MKASKKQKAIAKEVAAEWHPTKNGDRTPDMFTYGSGYRAWWKCSECEYEWAIAIRNRSNGNGCPACAGKAFGPKGIRSLAIKRPEIASQWHPTRNATRTPNMFTHGSHYRAWWECAKCGYEWEGRINDMARGSGCPFCAGRCVGRNGEKSLQAEYPKIVDEWHKTKNKDLSPKKLRYGSRKLVWWQCLECKHEWQAKVFRRTGGSGCPFCANKAVGNNGEKSLAAEHSEVAAEWHRCKNSTLSPAQVRPQSSKRVWWECAECGHEWQAIIHNRTNEKSGCPRCNFGRTAQNMALWLLDNWEALLPAGQKVQLSILRGTGISATRGPGRSILEAAIVGKINRSQLSKFVRGEDVKVIQRLIRDHNPRDYGGKELIPRKTKQKIFDRDQRRCRACSRSERDIEHADGSYGQVVLHCDHIIPESLGGGSKEDNLQTLCRRCNSIKYNKMMSLEEIRVRYAELNSAC